MADAPQQVMIRNMGRRAAFRGIARKRLIHEMRLVSTPPLSKPEKGRNPASLATGREEESSVESENPTSWGKFCGQHRRPKNSAASSGLALAKLAASPLLLIGQ